MLADEFNLAQAIRMKISVLRSVRVRSPSKLYLHALSKFSLQIADHSLKIGLGLLHFTIHLLSAPGSYRRPVTRPLTFYTSAAP